MLPSLIEKKTNYGITFYRTRRHFYYRELLVHLPTEMLEAKRQIGAEVECYGYFWSNEAEVLMCTVVKPIFQTSVYSWNPTTNKWVSSKEYFR